MESTDNQADLRQISGSFGGQNRGVAYRGSTSSPMVELHAAKVEVGVPDPLEPRLRELAGSPRAQGCF